MLGPPGAHMHARQGPCDRPGAALRGCSPCSATERVQLLRKGVANSHRGIQTVPTSTYSTVPTVPTSTYSMQLRSGKPEPSAPERLLSTGPGVAKNWNHHHRMFWPSTHLSKTLQLLLGRTCSVAQARLGLVLPTLASPNLLDQGITKGTPVTARSRRNMAPHRQKRGAVGQAAQALKVGRCAKVDGGSWGYLHLTSMCVHATMHIVRSLLCLAECARQARPQQANSRCGLRPCILLCKVWCYCYS